MRQINLMGRGIIIATDEKRIADWLEECITPFIGRYDEILKAVSVNEFNAVINLARMMWIFIETEFFGGSMITHLDLIKQQHPELQVVLFSVYTFQSEVAARYLWWGGDSFVSLRSPSKLIQKQLRVIFNRHNTINIDILDGIKKYNKFSEIPPRFTPREVEIIRCIAKGKSIKETAKAIGMDEGTVANYLSKMYDKCGIVGKIGIVKAGFTVGVLTPDDMTIQAWPQSGDY
jgi:DNA-binding NarL/FixJ family response regulator